MFDTRTSCMRVVDPLVPLFLSYQQKRESLWMRRKKKQNHNDTHSLLCMKFFHKTLRRHMKRFTETSFGWAGTYGRHSLKTKTEYCCNLSSIFQWVVVLEFQKHIIRIVYLTFKLESMINIPGSFESIFSSIKIKYFSVEYN